MILQNLDFLKINIKSELIQTANLVKMNKIHVLCLYSEKQLYISKYSWQLVRIFNYLKLYDRS